MIPVLSDVYPIPDWDYGKPLIIAVFISASARTSFTGRFVEG